MVTNNSDNISSAGLVKYDGAGTFSGVTVTQHDVLVGSASNGITSVAPSSTSGVPLVSGGSSADPSFTTAVVAGGGTGLTSTTAYGVICGGTTTTGNLQNAGAGSSGQLLVSGGAAALPSWTGAGASGASLVLIQFQNVSGSSAVTFTTGITSTYNSYLLVCSNVIPGTNNQTVLLQISTDGGSTYQSTSYNSGFNSTPYNSATWTNATSTSGLLLFNTLPNTTPVSSGQFFLGNMTDGNGFPGIRGQLTYNGGAGWRMGLSGGTYNSSATVNAFQIIAASGTITGKFGLYGIRES